MPIFPSPSYHGYDVTDYFAVNPQYGTMEDFERLLDEAHARGIRVLIDLVLNHTSDQHPWFQQAKLGPNSPYRDWYIWSETNPGYSGPWGERVWHSSPTGYYYGIFESFMPDLNYTNPEVTQQMDEVVRFWLQDVGVDGFRLDAAKHLIEDGARQENTSATHQWYEAFRPTYKAISPQAMTVGELFGDDLPTLASYTQGDQLDLAFNFELAYGFLNSAVYGEATPTANPLKYSDKLLPPLQYATFLANHDQNRVLSQLIGNVNQAKVAASLLLTSPGVPFIYYGDDIGLEGEKDPDSRRAFPWDQKEWNVELRRWVKTLVTLRKRYPSLRRGDFQGLLTPALAAGASVDDANGHYIFTRTLGEEKFVVALNASAHKQPVNIPVASLNWTEGRVVQNLIDQSRYTVAGGNLSITLPPTSGMMIG
jgi:glycosidase